MQEGKMPHILRMARIQVKVIALTILGLICQCYHGGPAAATNALEITVANISYQSKWLKHRIASEWNVQHPDVKVTYLPMADYYNQILNIFVTTPFRVDIVRTNAGYMVPWADAGWIEQIGEAQDLTQILSQSQYATQVTNMTLPFSQKPLVEIQHTNLIVPASYQVNFDSAGNGQVVPKKATSFIVYVGELRNGDWKYHDEFNTQHNLSQYPYVGHLDDIDHPTSDLNFGVPEVVYYTATIYTNNNLLQYHNTFIQELISRYGKLLTCYAKIDTSIINTLDFRNLININGVVYRLQKISDYDSTKDRTTQIELLRLIQGEGTPIEDDFETEGDTPQDMITEVEQDTIINGQLMNVYNYKENMTYYNYQLMKLLN